MVTLGMARRDELTDEQWAIIEPFLPPPLRREDGKGRPRVHDDRSVMNGVLWVLRTGTCWMDLPDRFPSGSTCYRRFSHWVKTGALRQVLEALAQHLEESKNINLSECFIDGTFVVAKKGGQLWERPRGARVQSSWWLRTLQVSHSASTRLLLHLMKSPLSKRPSLKCSRWDDPEELSGIVPMTVIRLMKGSRKWALN